MNLGPLGKAKFHILVYLRMKDFMLDYKMRWFVITVQVNGMIPLRGSGGATPRFVQRTQLIAQNYQVV